MKILNSPLMIISMGEYRFLLINAAVVILLLFLFLRGKKGQAPSQMHWGPKKLGEKPKVGAQGERNLNCLFQYNGHTWDAHEILGVPAGSPPEMIHEGFQKALKSAKDEQSRIFIRAAMDALKQQGQA